MGGVLKNGNHTELKVPSPLLGVEGSIPSPPILPNHIKEYLDVDSSNEKFLELFEADSKDIDLRTDLDIKEIVAVHKLRIFSDFISSKNITGIYENLLESYLRLKISFERKSRMEFVDIHRKERFEQNLKKFGDFSNILKAKE